MSSTTNFTKFTSPLLKAPMLSRSGLSVSQLLALDSARVNYSPGVAVCAEMNYGAINAQEIQDGTVVTISVAGSGAQVGDILKVFVDNVLVAQHTLLASEISNTGTATGSGVATVAISAATLNALTQGPHYVTSQITYASGSLSNVSIAKGLLTIDTVAPVAPITPVVTDDVGQTVGVIAEGAITDDNKPLISGTVITKSNTVEVFDNGVSLGKATVNTTTGQWTLLPGTALVDGPHSITIIESDRAGNPSPMSAALQFVVDTGAAVVNITSAADNVGDLQANVVSGGVTDDTMPTLMGSANANAVVTLREGSTVLGTTVANAQGQWTFTPNTAQTQGAHTYTASTTVAGNTTTSAGFVITVDSIAPVTSTLIGTDDVGSIAGPIAVNGATDDTKPTFSGVTEANAVVKVYDGAVLLGTTTANASGAWTFTPTSALTQGAHSVTATATDAAGNTSTVSAALPFTVDTTAPVAVLDAVTLTEDFVTSAGNVATNDTGLQGGETFALVGADSSGNISSTYVGLHMNSNGSYTLVPNTANIHAITANVTETFTYSVTDAAGHTSQSTLTFIVTPVNDAAVIAGATTGAVTEAGGVANAIAGTPTASGTLTSTDVDGVANAFTAVTAGSASTSGYGTYAMTAGGAWTYTLNNTHLTVQALAAAQTLTDTFTVTAADGTPKVVTVTITGTNDAPIVSAAVPDQVAVLDSAFSYTVPAGAFTDLDNSLTYTATLDDGSALPSWLTFDAITRTFSGTPNSTLDFNVKVTASDGTAVISDIFQIGIAPVVNSVAISSATGIQNSVLNAGDTVTTTVSFSELVNVTGAPQLTLNIGGTPVLATYVSGSGTNTLTFSYTILPGQTDTNGISLTANALVLNGGTIKDAVGNNATLATAAVVDNASYMVDTTAPATTVLTAVLSADNGTSSNDFITSVAAQTISGTLSANLAAGETVYVSLNNGSTWTAATGTVGSNAWSLSGATLNSGSNTLLAKVVDTAGNGNTPLSKAYSLIPVSDFTVGITNIFDDAGTTSTVLSGGTSNDATPTLNGTLGGATQGAALGTNEVVNVYRTPNLATATVVQAGTLAGDQILSGNALTYYNNGNGNYGSTGNVYLPTAPANGDMVVINKGSSWGINVFAGTTAIDSIGGSDNRYFKWDAALGQWLTGTNALVKVGTATVTTNAAGQSIWTLTDNSGLGNNDSVMYVAQIENTVGVFGNQSTPNAFDWKYTVDNVAPAAITLIGTDDVGAIIGPIAANGVTDDTNPIFSGTTEANAVVKVYDGATLIGTTTANGSGAWTFTPTTALSNGAHSVTATATDAHGNTSAATAALPFTVDTNPPTGPTLMGTDDVGSLTGPIAANAVTDDTKPTFSGNAEANSVVKVYDGATLLGTTIATAGGTWSFTPTTALAQGAHSVTATATNGAGVTSPATAALAFTVDTAAAVAVADANTGTEDVLTLAGNVGTNDTGKDGSETYSVVGSATGLYGNLVLGANGAYTYTRTANLDAIQTTAVETFTYQVTDAAGNSTQSTLTLNMTPVNDAAVIAGTSTATLTETNVAQTATGTLTITDVDSPATFVAQTATAGTNGYGKFSLTAAGVWTYTMDSAHDEFKAGTTYTDSITVAAADGTAKLITVTINGTNDAAVIAGTNTATLTQSAVAQTATGTLTSTDVDGTANLFTAQSNIAGSNNYGTFSVTTAGVWTYTMNTAHAEFVAGTAYTDSITVAAADGTTKVVTVTINGTNDAAVIIGTLTGAVTEAGGVANAIVGTPTATGTLTSTDPDGVANAFTAVAAGAISTGGFGTYAMTAAGVWTYTLNNNNATVQALAASATLTDTFIVTAADGTAKTINVTITGSNDAAAIAGVSTATLTQNTVAQAATGTLTSTDVDGTANLFAVQTNVAGSNNYGTFSVTAAGVWTYTMNTAHAEFVAGTAYTDSITVAAADGTTKVVTVTINGTNEAAVIGGVNTATLTETNVAQTASGTLTSTDVDGTANLFTAQTAVAGSNGYGKFSLTAAGVWTYTMDTAHNEFVAGTAYTDSITVATADGTTKVVTVTINGTNDAAVIIGTLTGSVTEAGGVANAIAGTPVATGTLTSTDADGTANAFNAVAAGTTSIGGYGTYAMTAAGAWTYTLNNGNTTVQALAAAATLTDTFTVTAADGTAKTINVTITGTNDAAVIAGVSTATLTQNTVAQTATGTLTSTDVDGTANLFTAQSNIAGSNNYGTFSVTAAGAWTYTMNTAHAEFVAGTAYTDSITVAAADGTTKVVTVTINGTNDAAVIVGTITGSVTEAGGVANAIAGTPTATGTLTSTDADGVANAFTAVAAGATSTGGYGTYAMTAAGVWTYTLNNANATVQALAASATLTDTFTVTAADGTAKTINVTITGSNDAAVIIGTVTGTVIEAGGVSNAIAGTPTVTGTLTSTDVDGVANAFTAVAAGTTSTGGYGTYAMTAGGVWTYTLNNSNATVQALAAAATLTDTFTVTAADGTAKTINVTIIGTNDAAVIAGTNTATLTQSAVAQTASGTLTSTDVDGTANLFTAQTTVAGTNGYGKFSLTAAGVWTYTMDTAHNEFVAGTAYTDSITVAAADGTTKVVTVTINGTNDAAVIIGTLTGSVTEAGGVSNAIAGTPVATGTLTSTDADGVANAFTAVAAGTTSTGGYGTYAMTAAGAWTYTLNNGNATVQALAAAATLTDTFTVTAADGTAKTINVTITGTNDAAVIGGVNTASLTESYDVQTASGMLTATDVDGTANLFIAKTNVAGNNNYGTFSVTAAGMWTYTMNTAHIEFAAGMVYTDSITVAAADGTTKLVTVTMYGVNDSANIGGVTTATLTETNVAQTATGTLTITDMDSAATFVAQTATAGTNGYGKFSLTAAGVWTYTMDTAHNEFKAGTAYTDSFDAVSADGTTQSIVVTINGTNDAAVITGVITGAVTEAGGVANAIAGTPTATGTLTSTDVDGVANAFTAVAAATTSTGGYGTYAMTAGGAWTYTLNNTNATVQALQASQTLTDTFTVNAADGTAKVVSVTITGSNDAPVVAVAIPDQMAVLGAAFSYTLPAGSFTDVDSTLTYTATRGDGTALPTWLTFNAATRTFSGTPTSTIDFNIKVTASDGVSSISDTFLLALAPVATSVAITGTTGIQNNFLNAGDTITATVNFSELVNVTGTPQLTLNIGGTLVKANYVSGSGTGALTFSYTILDGQTDANGISVNANSLGLNGGTITDAAGNNATQNFAGLTDNISYKVDTTAPTVGTLTLTETGSSLTDGITNNGTITVGALEAGATWEYSTDSGNTWFMGSGTSFTLGQGTYAAGALLMRETDLAGNVQTGPLMATNAAAITVDQTAPLLVGSNPGDNGYLAAVGNNLVLNFDEDVAKGTGAIQLYKADGTLVQSFDAATSTALTWSGNNLTINPTADLLAGTGYYIKVAATAVKDVAGNAYAGIADATTLNFTTPDASGAIVVPTTSSQTGVYLGQDLSTIGDFNGDGYDDFIVGAGINNSTGAAYVIYGNASGTVPDLSGGTIAASAGFKISTGLTVADYFGVAVNSVGDTNGDGLADLVVTAKYAGNAYPTGNSAFVVFGQSNASTVYGSSFTVGNGIAATNGYQIHINETYLGHAVSNAGDVNGDGLSDLLVTSDFTQSRNAYVIYGKTGSQALNLTSYTEFTADLGYNLFSGAVANLGASVYGAGDVNGDGLADFVIGANNFGTVGKAGAAFVVYGNSTGTPVQLDANNNIDASQGFKITGLVRSGTNSYFGTAVSSAGDVNGDGLADVMVSSPYEAANGGNSASGGGVVYVLYGNSSGTALDLNVSNGVIDPSRGFKVTNGNTTVNSNLGDSYTSLASAGDINGDGLSDMIMTGMDVGGGAHATYVVYGNASGTNVAIDASGNIAASNGFKLVGGVGLSVASAGDINGDGLNDLLVSSTLGGSKYSYNVVLGGTQWVTAALNGSGDFAGTAGDEALIGSTGNDTISGGGGVDRFFAGRGDDTLVLTASDIANLQNNSTDQTVKTTLSGGTGFDTLRLTGGTSLDLLKISNAAAMGIDETSRIEGMERIDMATDTAANMLKISNKDINDMAGFNQIHTGSASEDGKTWTNVSGTALGTITPYHQMVVEGGSNDTVALTANGGAWANVGTVSNGTQQYTVYQNDGTHSQLLVQQGVTVDTQAPTLLWSTPADNDFVNTANLGNNISLQFSENVVKGTGFIQLWNKTTGLPVQAFDVSTSALVTGWGTSLLSINPSANLLAGTDYFLKVSDNAIQDSSGLAYSGLNSDLQLNFSTQAADGSYAVTTSFASAASSSSFLRSVATAGDFNGDGYDDLLIGVAGSTESGVYVVYGNALGEGMNLDTNATMSNGQIAADQGFKIFGGKYLGESVTGIGDVNGDGFADVLIGNNTGDVTAGAGFVVYGSASPAALNLSSGTIAASRGYKIAADASYSNLGNSVAGVGDVNGDGIGDFIMGAPGDTTAYKGGAAFVVYGKTNAATLTFGTNGSIAAADGFKLTGAGNDGAGTSVSGAGDVNGDGLADVIVSAAGSVSNYDGAAYVILGGATGGDMNALVAAGKGFKITGASTTVAGYNLGTSVSSAGDVNGDGYADLIVSKNDVAAYVVYGGATPTSISLTGGTMAASQGFRIVGNVAIANGLSQVSSAGDMNGDGFADVVVGSKSGSSYVVYGSATGAEVNVSSGTIAASQGFKLTYSTTDATVTAKDVSFAGDFDGDGLTDLVIADKSSTSGSANSYKIVFGGTQWLTASVVGNGTVTGTVASEAILGSTANDTLTGGGGVDRFFAGLGDDTIVLTASDVANLANVAAGQTAKASVSGGGGFDTIQLSGGANLNLTTISNAGGMGLEQNSRIESIERIVMGADPAANTLTLTAKDVKDMSGFNVIHTGTASEDGNVWTNTTGTALSATTQYHQLVVNGTDIDTVVLAADAGFWVNVGTVSNGVTTYTVYQNAGNLAQVLVKAGVIVTNNDSVAPVVIDMNHDGQLSYGHVTMDVNGDGQLDHTAWAGAQDGVLVWDKYQDNVVHDNSQYAFSQYGAAGSTDLQGLAAAFDSNHDGEFDARDAKFAQFSVWQDANQNGVSDAGEVHTLAEAGIASIHLSSDGVVRNPADGVTEAGRTTATGTDGQSVLVADAAFEFHTAPVATASAASDKVLNLADVLPAPDWQAHDITSAHVSYSLNSTSLLTDELMHKLAM
ncbi:hypothetical protein C5F52_08475 [Limnohabitans sp. TS-CS-82]|uniref:beta strand repeat-containing protein n=1 Tax=Limnohabitans sp. TS-CS-82 TaxID=2094193 RepID=UPI000CF24FE5|nr:VCBS domain-containing protein [Limnohabitans sp. TS-CS-82]PQA83473.1 hypothetical protein C5F52_08475 [Limnohabitans sp. TS-CS-82]